MPGSGVPLTPNSMLLNSKEMFRIASLLVRQGVSKIRLSGGEPLLRKDIVNIVFDLNRLRSDGLQVIAMTTNGIVLSRFLPSLVDVGLDAVNISLDTLDPIKFPLITRRLGHENVIQSIESALQSGLSAVKINCVVMRGVNADELTSFVEFTRNRDLEVRFIELMPFAGNNFDPAKFVPYLDMLDSIKAKFADIQKCPTTPNEVSKVYRVPGYKGRVGFVTSMSQHFCGSCNRLRLTADGNLKSCLFDSREVSLRDAIRQGASDEELGSLIHGALQSKRAQHAGIDMIEAARSSNRPMITIGG